MSTNYPDNYDNLTARTDASTATPNAHAQDHTDERDAINAIESELGLAPSGAAATVRARLDTLDTTVSGKADSTHATQHENGGADELALDASQTTTGNFDVARLGTGTPSAFTFLDGTGAWTDDVPVFVPVKNTSGATIAKGAPVYATGTVGATSVIEIAPADADVTAKMPAIGLTTTELTTNATGYVTVVGTVKGVNTNSYTVNQTLYVSTTPGALTSTKPTGAAELIQGIGRVTRVGTNNGEILVLGAGRTNDVPNAIDAGKLTSGTVAYDRLPVGTTSDTVAAGNDSRFTDARTPTAHAATHGASGGDAITIANTQVTGLGTSATKDIPAAGNASTSQVVYGTDTRLTDARTPTSHVHAGTDITTGTVDPARLGSGSSITTKFLRGDSTWQTITAGGVATDAIFDAKGDLPVGTGADTAAKLTVGANGTMLFADSAETTGVKWAQYRSQALKFNTDDYWLMSHSALATGYAAISTGSSVANSNNVVVYCPFSISEEISVKALALHCVAANAGASAVLRLGIYNADATTGKPSTVVVDGGTVSVNSTATIREVTFTSVTLKPGFYFYAVATQSLDTGGANPTFSGCATSGSGQGAQETAPAVSNNLFQTWTSSSVTGAFGSSPTVTLTRGLAAKIFHVWAKVA